MNNTISIKFDRLSIYSGENKCTTIEITLSRELINYWIYLDFVKPDGSKFKTPRLEVNDNKAFYEIPSSLIDQKGFIQTQVVAENESGVILKSAILKRKIYDSINATNDIPNKESFITKAQSILDKMDKFKSDIEKGINPSIGENGNWFVSGIDTGKPSRGKDGEPGKDGTDGVDGENYILTDDDKSEIVTTVKTNLQSDLDDNLKTAKDYTDNSISRDFKDISFDQNTMTFIFTRHDNTTFTVDLPVEQTVKNGRYDEGTKELVLVLVSDQEIKIPASGLIDDYDGSDTATIQCSVSADNKISCNIISGSISKTLLTTELQAELNSKATTDSLNSKINEVKDMIPDDTVDTETFNNRINELENSIPSTTEEWTFTLEDGSTVTKKVVLG